MGVPWVSTTDEVVVTIARKLAESLAAAIPLLAEPEGYTGLELSAGWLAGVKQRHRLGCRVVKSPSRPSGTSIQTGRLKQVALVGWTARASPGEFRTGYP